MADLTRGWMVPRVNEVIDEYRWTAGSVSPDHPGFAEGVRHTIESMVADSVRSVEALVTQGSSRPLGDGGIEVGRRTIRGIDYSVRAWDDDTRRLHVSMPVEGNEQSGYSFPTMRVGNNPTPPQLSRDQIERLAYRFTLDGWDTVNEVHGVVTMDEGRPSLTFDIPILSSDVGRVEGLFHTTGADEFFWHDGTSNFTGYVFAAPDRQEMAAARRRNGRR